MCPRGPEGQQSVRELEPGLFQALGTLSQAPGLVEAGLLEEEGLHLPAVPGRDLCLPVRPTPVALLRPPQGGLGLGLVAQEHVSCPHPAKRSKQAPGWGWYELWAGLCRGW